MIDIHTHILPGVDDGAKDWDTCLKMLVQSAECGVKAVIATPHFRPWDKEPTKEEIYALCEEAKEKLWSEHQIEMQIYPGNEIYYSVDVMDELKKGNALTLAGSRYILVEFKEQMSYQAMYRAVRDFRDGGYIPILAHIERYQCMHKMENVKNLKEGGALFQINAEVLRGGFWDAGTQWTKRCLRKGLIDFVASDMHNLKTRRPFAKQDLRWISKKLDPQYQSELLCENAEEIINT